MNALALVQGFVRLSRRDSIEHFARAVQDRVDVLARTHATLAKTRWADVTLDRVLKDELAPQAGRTVLEGPQVLISAARVQAFALMIHELTSNATLHGALSQPDGRLEVSWRTGGEQGVVDLAWREHGAPAADGLGSPGFGRRLIASIVRRQLQGRMSQTWGPEGLTTNVSCRVVAPASPDEAALV